MLSRSQKDTTCYRYATEFGTLAIAATEDAICAVSLGDVEFDGVFEPSSLTNRCATELMEYFSGKRFAFSMPLHLSGTVFQQKVWRAVENIPYGQTRTSREIAQIIGSPGSYKMVGRAVRQNPCTVLVPTHRIVDAYGRPVGTGHAANVSGALLALERGSIRP